MSDMQSFLLNEQINYDAYDPRCPFPETKRLHAIYRYENRASIYNPQYLAKSHKYNRYYHIGHAQGSGYLLGVTMGISKTDGNQDWYHNGAELIIIDQESNPNVLKGTGGEDFFGSSCHFSGHHNFPEWGFQYGKSRESFSAYRWFVETAQIPFESSFTFKYGGLLNYMSSVMYWYQEGSVMPQVKHIVSKDEDKLYAHNPSIPPPTGMITHWDVSSHHAIKNYHKHDRKPTNVHFTEVMNVAPEFGFISLGEYFLPYGTNEAYPVNVFAWMRSIVHSNTVQPVRLMLTHDDPVSLFLNEELMYAKNVSMEMGFHTVNIHTKLAAGNNTFVVKTANMENMNTRAWVIGLNIYPISDDSDKEREKTKKLMYHQQQGNQVVIDGACE
jgi:hypothetical protein